MRLDKLSRPLSVNPSNDGKEPLTPFKALSEPVAHERKIGV